MTKLTKEEAKKELFDALNIDHPIIFHVYETDITDGYVVGSGIIGTPDDLYDTDRFYDIGYDNHDVEEIHVDSVTTYMIGDGGDSEHADSSDCAVIEDMLNNRRTAGGLMEFLEHDADVISDCGAGYVDNPCYEPEDDDYDI